MSIEHIFGVVLDFDNTAAETNNLSPNGIGVIQAYNYAVEILFGTMGFQQYRDTGGLRNRSPREVVDELQRAGFGTHHFPVLATEDLVRLKLKCLMSEIGQKFPDGTIWPRLTPGFAKFWQRICENPSIFRGIISSGHRDFITKTFRVHELELPNYMLTDDELRNLSEPLCKPDKRLWELMLTGSNARFDRTIYFGDDAVKDGELAKNAGVPFLHFAPKGTKEYGQMGTFADWRELDLFMICS